MQTILGVIDESDREKLPHAVILKAPPTRCQANYSLLSWLDKPSL